ncbi:MAG: hypothetical protein IIW42_07815 [Bacteroidaceae bacterium]|nr:hypothetical protein [Bacteroidaceae bacterium]
MEKINIAELLKNCPKGMELDCTMYDNLYFDFLNADYYGTINCYTLIDGIKTSINFTKYGTFNNHIGAKCVIYPKGKTTWEGFVPPCLFKKGDVVYTIGGSIAILGDRIGERSESFNSCCGLFIDGFDTDVLVSPMRLATEEEKAKLFQAIKDNGYRWNAKTKTLEKLVEPKFKIGDIIKDKCNLKWKVINANGHFYEVSLVLTGDSKLLEIKAQDDYELVPKKFDVSKLKPFDKVLTRQTSGQIWNANLFSHKIDKNKKLSMTFVCLGGYCQTMCIPYEGNEHLLGTTDDCDEYFKTWK